MGCAGSKAAEEPAGSGGSKPVETTEIKVEADPERKKSIQAGKRRVGVSAEATKEEDDKDYKPTVIPKSDEARERIGAATDKNALFAGLNAEQRTAVIDAMFEIQCTAAQDVILMATWATTSTSSRAASTTCTSRGRPRRCSRTRPAARSASSR
jgi:hypothetical protein